MVGNYSVRTLVVNQLHCSMLLTTPLWSICMSIGWDYVLYRYYTYIFMLDCFVIRSAGYL